MKFEIVKEDREGLGRELYAFELATQPGYRDPILRLNSYRVQYRPGRRYGWLTKRLFSRENEYHPMFTPIRRADINITPELEAEVKTYLKDIIDSLTIK